MDIDGSGFIGGYRVSSLIASTHFCELYEAYPRAFQGTSPVILAFWPEVGVNSNEEANVFQQKVRQGSIRSGVDTLPILDADFDNGHPYIVTSSGVDMLSVWRKHALFIDQALQEAQSQYPEDARLFTQAFLDVFMGRAIEAEPTLPGTFIDQSYLAAASLSQVNSASIASDVPYNTPYAANAGAVMDGPPPVSLPPAKQRKVKWYQIALLVLLLILIIWGGSALYTIIPASSASITITPEKTQFNQNYSLGVVARNPGSFEVQGRQISVTSQHISKTVPATGNGHHNATQARGNVVLSQIQLDNPSTPNNLGVSSISDANGLQIITDDVVPLSQGGTVTIAAHADQAGSGGNISADDLDQSIIIVNTLTQAQIGTGYVSNPTAFTGGTDASDFTFVKQSDLDHVTQPFLSQVTPATQEKVMQQIQTGEHLAQDMECKPIIASNHRVNDEASAVTVQVSVVCQALVYSDQVVHTAAASLYQHDGVAKFGDGYNLVGDMVMGTILTSDVNNDPQLVLNVAGIWSFQYTDARKQDIERMIAGKSQDAARLLLHARKDIQHVVIATSGIPGSALPSSPESITIIVTKVTGLHAS
jgi:hypothetical protein